jgi:hypothetical protein
MEQTMRSAKTFPTAMAVAILLCAGITAQAEPGKGADKISITGLVAQPSPFDPSANPLSIDATFQIRAALVMGGGNGDQQTHHVRATYTVEDAQGAVVRSLTGESEVVLPPGTKGNDRITVHVVVTWDGNNGQGLRVPDGVYTIKVSGSLLKRNVDGNGNIHEHVIDTSSTATTSATLAAGTLDTSITQFPPSQTNSTSAIFTFTANVPGCTFKRSLDGGAFVAATSPETLNGLVEGAHTYRVYATDPGGNVDPTPATYSWTVDLTPPDTSITQAPPNPSSSASATFAFAATEASCSFERSLDGGDFVLATSPEILTGLADGPHTCHVRAKDAAGNIDPTPAVFSWTVDTLPPDTSIAQAPPAASNSNSAAFAYATTEPGCAFERKLDNGTFVVVGATETLAGLADGSHTVQVRARDAAGNVDPTPAIYTWTVDTVPPDTTITQAPPAVTSATSATFAFTASEAVCSFQGSLDGAAFVAVLSPLTLQGIAEGSHVYRVRAVDPAGNVDPTPATHPWVIDATPPDTTISQAPPALTNATTATFAFTASEAGCTFEGKLDGATFQVIASPLVLHGLGEGAHTYQVRARDAAGNVDASPATFTWTIDTTPPETTLTQVPPSPSGSSSAMFAFTASEAGCTFQRSLDGGGYVAVGSPDTLLNLEAGAHLYRVRAVDAAGNIDATPAEYAWTIDLTPPDTTITQSPPQRTNSTSAVIAFTASKTGCTFQGSLDGVVFAAVSSPVSLGPLAEGTHTYQVRAIDTAGLIDPTPASATWTVDVTPPTTTISLAPPALTNESTAMIAFASSESGCTFEGSLDGAIFTAVVSPVILVGLSDGAHNYQIRAMDAAGNVESAPVTYTWKIDTIPPVIISSGSPAANTAGWNNTNITVHFEATDPGSGVISISSDVTVNIEGANQVIDGIAKDFAGNTSATSFTANIDKTPPNLTLTPADGTMASTNPPAFVVTYADGLSGVDTNTLQILVDENNSTNLFNITATSATYTPGAPLSNGTHTLKATLQDKAGNPASASANFTIGTTTTPEPPFIATMDKKTNDNTPVITGTSAANTTVRVYRNAAIPVQIGDGIADDFGFWTIHTIIALSDETYYIFARSYANGTESDNSNLIAVTIDTIPPAPPKGLKALPFTGGVDLSWSPNQESDLLGYYVFRKQQWDPDFIRLNWLPIIGTRYRDEGLYNGMQYIYRIDAVDNAWNERHP